MDGLQNLFRCGMPNPTLQKDAIAQMLKISPEALSKFEESYKRYTLTEEPDGFFQQNSRQAVEQNHLIDMASKSTHADTTVLERRIVDELLSQTTTYFFDGNLATIQSCKALPTGAEPVTLQEVTNLPPEIQPQLTGTLMKRDIGEESGQMLLYQYKEYLDNPNTAKGRTSYHMFRQGLDILDLDGLTYEIIGTNPNSMGHWFPQLVEACRGKGFFKIPATAITKVPMTLLQLTRQEYGMLTQTTLSVLDKWAHEAFRLDDSKEYFIKTGTYSSKFDFRNAHVKGAKEVQELGEYLLFIHYQALQMASPLSSPCIYGASTTNEWVVREWIEDTENNPCIYKGLPLRTEYRIFIDCDQKTVIGCTPYWEPQTMKQRFGHEEDANSPHQIHDYIIYKAHEETLMRRYYENIERVKTAVIDLLPDLHLHGQWSLDIMQTGNDFWLIDMGVAENSAFYRECVPESSRVPTPENWLQQLTDGR